MIARLRPLVLLLAALSLPAPGRAALSQTSFASWYDARGAVADTFFGHVNVYALQANTTINLYRVGTENTSIAGAPVATWTSTVANQPFHYPVNTANGPNDHTANWYQGTANAFYRLVATHPTAPAGTNLVNWDLNSPDKSTYLDSHTFLVGESGTYLANLFHTYLFYNDSNTGSNTSGMSLAVLNPGASTLNVTVNKWNSGTSTWNAAPATATGGNTVSLGAGKIWMYGGVTQANTGDYQVVVTGGDAIVYKGCMFELDHDNAFMAGVDQTGFKLGNTVYGAMNSDSNFYGPSPGGQMALTAFGGPSVVDLYYYSYSGTASFPATTAGSWNLWVAGVNVPATGAISLAPGLNGIPAIPGAGGSKGMFIKAVATGAPIQMECGANIMSGVAGDGDWLASDNGRALGTLFHPTNGNYDGAYLSNNNNPRIVVIMPSSGTTVNVTSPVPAAPVKAAQSYTSATPYEAHSFAMVLSNAVGDIGRAWNVSSDKPIYCFLETAGTAANEMEKMYSAVAPVPGVDMAITKKVDKLQVDPGGNLTYNIVVTNYGSESATSVAVWDTIPVGLVMPPVSDSQSAFVTLAGSPGTMRRWVFPSIPPDGAAVTISMVVQVDPAQATGAKVFANQASVLAGNDATVHNSTPAAISYAIAQVSACRQAWGTWEDNPTSGTHAEGFLHILAQRDNTTVVLRDATNLDAGSPPMAINNTLTTINLNAGQTYSYPGSQASNPTGSGGGFNTKFFKLESSNYPVSWELDSQNAPDRAGRQMMVNSVDGRFSANAPFYTYLDYYHKDCGGPPKCYDSSRYGDALVVVNPNTGGGQTARFQVFNSFNAGTTWNYVGDYTVAPEGSVLFGGSTLASSADYIVVPYTDATTAGLPLIVYKGNSINTNVSNAMTDSGALFGVAENGTKAANAGETIYGLSGVNGGPNIIVTSLAAGTTAQVYKYTPSTAVGPDWPIAGNAGTWAAVGGAMGPLAIGANATYSTAAKGLYKVEVTAGAAEALFGSNMLTNFSYGDGDMVASRDNRAADWLPAQSTSIFKGRDFRFTSGGQNGGNLQVIAPNIGTTVSITGGSINTGGGSGRTTSTAPPASTVADQAWRFEISQSNANYTVTASDDVIVIYQDRGNDHEAKAYAGMPLVLCVVLTPTPTPTASSTRTATPTVTPSPSPSATPTVTATRTSSVTPSASPSATLTSTPSSTSTQTATLTVTLTATPSATSSSTVTQSFTRTITPSATPTATSTSTQSPGPSPTNSPTFTGTPTSSSTVTQSFTRTITPSATPTATSTSTQSPGPSPTNSPSFTPTATVTVTPSITPSITQTLAFSATNTPSSTATLTVSPTPTSTATRTGTPSCTVTPSVSFTPTFSPTLTESPTLTSTLTPSDTNTATPTFSVSPTGTQTWTASPTPMPLPNQVRIGAYNSAGELVKLLFDGPAQFQVGQLNVGNGVVAGGSGTLTLSFPGYLYDTSTGSLSKTLTWAADNNGGQLVDSGIYTLKAEIKDSFGQITTLQQSVQVLNVAPQNTLSIYNSAGELVRSLALPAAGTGRFSSMRFDDAAIAVRVDEVTGAMLGEPLKIYVTDEKGQEASLTWDGLNSQGQPVASGTYTAELVFATAGAARQVVSSKSLAVINAGPLASLSSAVAYPNPVRSGADVQVAYTPSAGTTAVGRLYDLAGELVSQAEDLANLGRLSFPGGSLAGGIYIIKVEKRSGAAVLARVQLKVAVVH